MAVLKQNGDMIPFLKQKDYIMVNNNLGGGSFGKTVLLQDPFIDELFVAKKYEPEYPGIREQFYKNFLDEIKILYKLNHRNVVRIYNYYAYKENFTGYILMEYIDGNNIGDFIIRKKSDVISSIVDCDYSYNLKIEIPRKTVEDFLEWFRNSTPQSQALILNNFISKISDIRVEEPEPELPF